MESTEHPGMATKCLSANELAAGFDIVKGHSDPNNQYQPTALNSISPSATGTETAAEQSQISLFQSQRAHSVSISMPSSPMEFHLESTKSLSFSRDNDETIFNKKIANSSAKPRTAEPKLEKFHSQPMPTSRAFDEAVATRIFPSHPGLPPRIDRQKDKMFDSFKTWSGKLDRKLSNLRGKPILENGPEENTLRNALEGPALVPLPVHRFFDALEGPELDTLRDSEELLLPADKKWPFLLRYPVNSFGVCLGISSQAIMWKTLATAASMKFLNVSLNINLIMWCVSVVVTAIVFFIYSLKVVFYFEAVRREYYHPVRVNFFFAPWITLLFLAIGVPPSVTQNLHKALWYILMSPIICLELKIYGQWMSGGQRMLSKVANPSNHLSVVGNFVGALLGASMGLKEGPILFFAVGLAHYTVLFVTLYQRLPTNETVPKELHPVFFLFVAAPSVASVAWARIQGSFDYGSRIAYFVALFLFFSLAVRVNFFRGFRFSLSWWAYTFPMTGVTIATVKYSNEVTNIVTKSLSIILCAIATLTVAALLVTTFVHACVLQDLFPNDIPIAISLGRPKTTRKWYHRRSGSSDVKDIEASLTHATSSTKQSQTSGVTEVDKSPPQ